MDKKTGVSVLNNLRQARRSVSLREETDPVIVAEKLEKILKEAIVLRSSGSNAFAKGAVEELRAIQNAMVAQQIDVGNRTIEFQGKFATVLEQIQKIETKKKEDQDEENPAMGAVKALRDNLPSAETITSAIMTGNPLLGYGIKMIRDLVRSGKEGKKERREFEQRRLQALKEEEAFLLEQIKNEEIKEDLLKAENKDTSKREPIVRRKGIYDRPLQEIRSEIAELNKRLGGDHESRLEVAQVEAGENEKVLERITEETHNKLEKINDTTEKNLERIHQNDVKRMELERERLAEQNLKNREAEFENKNPKNVTQIFNQEKGGLGLNLPFLIGGLGGLVAGMAKWLLTPFIMMFKVLKSGARMLLKFGKFTGIIAAVVAIANFFDGIFSAGKILQRDPNTIGIKERILVGVAQAIKSILEPIDWLVEKLTGYNMFDAEGDALTRQIFYKLGTLKDDIYNGAVDLYQGIKDALLERFHKMKDAIKEWFNTQIETVKDIKDMIMNGPNQREGSKRGRSGQNNQRELQQQSEYRQDLSDYAGMQTWGRGLYQPLIEREAQLTNINNTTMSPVFAPNNNTSINTNNSYSTIGSSAESANNEPTHRRTNNLSRR